MKKDIKILGGVLAGLFLLNYFSTKSISGFFDNATVNSLDDLKKQYFKLAKVYHPDAGGTNEQFQQLQNEYEKLFNHILKGGSLNFDEQKNEIEIDEHLRAAIDSIVSIPNINIELIGKWIWVSGTTYPVKEALKAAGFEFIKKAGVPYWVFKGVESKSRGKMDIEEIRAKYGSKQYSTNYKKQISGVYFNKDKFLYNILILKQLLLKRK